MFGSVYQQQALADPESMCNDEHVGLEPVNPLDQDDVFFSGIHLITQGSTSDTLQWLKIHLFYANTDKDISVIETYDPLSGDILYKQYQPSQFACSA